jgi:hypothetical protein
MSLLLRRPPGREAYPGDTNILNLEMIEVNFKIVHFEVISVINKKLELEKDLQNYRKIDETVTSKIFYLTYFKKEIKKQMDEFLFNFSIPEQEFDKEAERTNSKLMEFIQSRLKKVHDDLDLFLEYKDSRWEKSTSFDREEYIITVSFHDIIKTLIDKKKETK